MFWYLSHNTVIIFDKDYHGKSSYDMQRHKILYQLFTIIPTMYVSYPQFIGTRNLYFLIFLTISFLPLLSSDNHLFVL